MGRIINSPETQAQTLNSVFRSYKRAIFLAAIPIAKLQIEFLLPRVSSSCSNGTSLLLSSMYRFMLPYYWFQLCIFVRLIYRERVRAVLVRGGTRPILSVWGVAAAASISRRVAVQPVLSLLLASENVSDLDLSGLFITVLFI